MVADCVERGCGVEVSEAMGEWGVVERWEKVVWVGVLWLVDGGE